MLVHSSSSQLKVKMAQTSMDGRMGTQMCVYIMEQYAAFKKSEIQIRATTWRNTEISQTQKGNIFMFAFVWGPRTIKFTERNCGSPRLVEGKGRMGGDCLMSTDSQFRMKKKFCRWTVVTAALQRECT